MSSFNNLKLIKLPLKCAITVYNHLQEFGDEGFEGVALWAGIQENEIFEIKATIIPEQKSYNLDSGLLYSVEADELHKINVWLYENKMVLIAQIHSHPGRAYHSDTDDAFPIITALGGLSFVVPNFATAPLNILDWACYRLHSDKCWKEVNISDMLNIT